jgi:hypothetical protein
VLKLRRLTDALKPDGGILPAKTRPGEGTESGFGQKFVGAANVASLIGRLGSSAFKPSATTFQTIHYCSVDVAHGLALLFGIGTKALVWGFFSQEV